MKIDKNSFESKTIKSLDTTCTNTLTFTFTDGTQVVLETEPVGHGIYGFGQYSPENYFPKKS